MNVVEIYCNAERRAVGTVVGQPGARISAVVLRGGFRPSAPEYAAVAERAADGVALVCPRCGNPLLFRQPETPGEPTRGLYAVPGAIRFARESGAD